MNISQHAFVPRTKINKGRYYSGNSSLSSITSIDTFTKQSREAINQVLFLGLDSGTVRYKITLCDPYYSFSNVELSEDKVLLVTRTSENIAFGNRFTEYPNLPRGMVFYVGFYQPQPAVLGVLSMPGDAEITDLNEETI